MADGEPQRRDVTKIGGLPYRPTSAKWPTDSTGDPLTFVAQFDFLHSMDIVGNLPGELLLVFAETKYDQIESLHFEWWNRRAFKLISDRDIPKKIVPSVPSGPDNPVERYLVKLREDEPDTPEYIIESIRSSSNSRRSLVIAPCYGYACRTVSYPDAKLIASYREDDDPLLDGKPVGASFFLPQYVGTQIGSAPFFIQGNPDLPGRLICTLGSVEPSLEQPFPWVNRSAPLSREDVDHPATRYLSIGDSGCYYISIDEEDNLHWCESCF